MTILITGASSGLGAAMARTLVKKGHAVIGAARREEQLDALHQELEQHLFFPLIMDVSDKASVDRSLAILPEQWRTIDTLINNAGLALGLSSADQADMVDWEIMVNTNILGLIYLTRQLLPSMVKNRHGQIINIGSTAGNWPYYGANVYGASKAFVKQFSRNLRADLAKYRIRVSNIEPGLCGDTEFSKVRFKGDLQKEKQPYENIHYLTPQDIADIVLFIYEAPSHVNINSLEVMPVAQTFAGLITYPQQE
ncbi:MAG: hypothetical protein DI619_03860 [Francisella sp.]|jgi:NADP-dependent L-serine/L-allo-threonine dehydrogenase ydfG|nr:MAG: hypothetical protein DI619_03860 [Francisella sp.]